MKLLWLTLGFLFTSTILHANDSWEIHKQKALSYQSQIPGWCSLEKAEKMMNLIYNSHPKICVEIGVFGGSSISPTAQALKYLNQGVVFAIDPWTNQDCTEGYSSEDANYKWWNSIDMENILSQFKLMLSSHGLTPYCKILRTTSELAITTFENDSIDILHVDGNHSEESALRDVMLYFPKVKKNGYIWFDDVNWSSTNKAVQYLKEHCTLNLDYSIGNSCYLFQKQ
jgi:hypothetical protein